jgi:hypothetical protein
MEARLQRRKVMPRWFVITLSCLSLVVFGVSAAVAQDDPGEAMDGISIQALPTCPSGQVPQLAIPFLNSIADTTGARSAAVITLLNNSPDNTCDWTILWKLTRSDSIARSDTFNNVPSGFSFNFCSRPIATGLSFCNDDDPALTFNEMTATICVTNTTDCRKVGAYARNYHTTGSADTLNGVGDLKVLLVNQTQRGD